MSLEFFSIPASPWSFSLLKLSGLLQQDPNLSTFAHPLWPASDSFTTPKAIDLNYLGFLWLDPFPEGFHMCWLPVPLGLCSALWMTLLSKFCAPKSLWTVTAAMKLKDSFWKESYDKRRQHIKKQRHHFANKGLYSQSYGFSNRHVRMWELDHKEGWEPKNWCFWIVVQEKTLESSFGCKEIKPINLFFPIFPYFFYYFFFKFKFI